MGLDQTTVAQSWPSRSSSWAGEATVARPLPPDRVTLACRALSASAEAPSETASPGTLSDKKTSVRSYHCSFLMLQAAQGVSWSRASTGTVKAWVPPSVSSKGMRSCSEAFSACSPVPMKSLP